MEGSMSASHAAGGGGGGGGGGDVSLRAPIGTTSAMRTASTNSTAGTDALSSSNSLDGVPSTGTATTNVSEISLPGMDTEDRVKTSQSATSAVMASITSTSDWIRSEVRSFKIIPGPFQPSTPPVQIAEGIEAMEGDRPRAKHEKSNEGDKHSADDGHEKNTPPDVVSGAARKNDQSESVLSNPLSFQFSQSSFKPRAISNNTQGAHSPWEANSADTGDSGPGPGIGDTVPLSEMEIKTIIECEKMNYLTSQTLLDREKDQEREHLERLESENVSRNWIEKLNGATESLQNKFIEMKNKMSPEGGTPLGRSRSASETLALPLSLTAVLSDMLTLNSTKIRRDSLTPQSEHILFV